MLSEIYVHIDVYISVGGVNICTCICTVYVWVWVGCTYKHTHMYKHIYRHIHPHINSSVDNKEMVECISDNHSVIHSRSIFNKDSNLSMIISVLFTTALPKLM